MSEFLFHYYPVPPTTWVYLSSFLMIGLFFKFGRFWSVRNLDLVLLILLAPGLLMVHYGKERLREERDALAAAEQDLNEVSLLPAEGGESEPVESESGNAASRGELPDDGPVLVPPGRSGGDNAETEEIDGTIEEPAVGGEILDMPLEETVHSAEDVPAEEGDPSFSADRAASTQVGTLSGRSIQFIGYLWLMGACALWLVRLLLDPAMVRRPLLEPNLAPGGMTFLGCSMFVFLMANVISSPVTDDDLAGPRTAQQMISGVAQDVPQDVSRLRRHGPGNALLHFVPSLVTIPLSWDEQAVEGSEVGYVRTAKVMAILSHLAIVIGIVAIGYWHFENIRMGIGAATLYLMLPYMSLMTGRVDHALPAALLVWAVLCYRRPLPAGIFIGLAMGVIYYPLFLLPLWMSFYWQRGWMRFAGGVAIALLISVLSLLPVSADWMDFLAKTQALFGIWLPVMEGLNGIWGLGWDPVYRLPIVVGFIAMSCAMAIWPGQKNLGTLLSCSAAVMVATQFWHGHGGGLYMAWFLPLLLLTIFRPNLEDRVALTVLGNGWRSRRRTQLNPVDQAA